ncbi:MAG: hypothetical protein WCJ29_04755 [bacterium]
MKTINENKQKQEVSHNISAHSKILLALIVIAVIFGSSPLVPKADAAWFNFSGNSSDEPISLVQQATLFAPDRYTLTIEKRVVTSYNSEVGQCDSTPFETAIGSTTRHGVVAANWLPIGTMVRFIDYDPETWYVVEDRMNERFSDRTDIWMANKADSKKFGKRTLAMEIARPVRK